MQERVHIADGVDLVLRRHLRPPAGRTEQRDTARTFFIPVLEPPVRRRTRRDVPVDAKHLIVSWPILLRLEHVVELVRARGIRGVRQREQVQERSGIRIDPVGRYAIAGEAGRAAGGRCAVARQQRIADEDQTTLVVERLREIALTLERGRNPPLVQGAWVGAAEEVLRPEEEQFVSTAVEGRVRDEHGSADRPRRVVERVERRLALRRLRGTQNAPRVLVAVQRVVALVERRAAMKVSRPAACDDGDRRARTAAVLGLEVRRLHANLGD